MQFDVRQALACRSLATNFKVCRTFIPKLHQYPVRVRSFSSRSRMIAQSVPPLLIYLPQKPSGWCSTVEAQQKYSGENPK